MKMIVALFILVCCFFTPRNDLNHLFDVFNITKVSLKGHHDLLCQRPFGSLKILNKQIFQDYNVAKCFLLFILKHDYLSDSFNNLNCFS